MRIEPSPVLGSRIQFRSCLEALAKQEAFANSCVCSLHKNEIRLLGVPISSYGYIVNAMFNCLISICIILLSFLCMSRS